MTLSHYVTMESMKRAVGEDQKAERRNQILEGAARCLSSGPVEDFTLAQVAEILSLVKGTIYRYFPTRESLIMEVLDREMNRWIQCLEDQWGLGSTPELDARDLAKALTLSLEGRDLLIRLFSVTHVVLERNIPLEDLISAKLNLAGGLERASALIEQVCPSLKGQGRKAALGFYLLLIGASHVTSRTALVEQALAAPGLESFRLELPSLLLEQSVSLFRGLSADQP